MTFDHAKLCLEKPPLRFERMPFIPRFKSLGFSGMSYKMELIFVIPTTVSSISVQTFEGNVTLTEAVENETQRARDGHREKCLWGAQGE